MKSIRSRIVLGVLLCQSAAFATGSYVLYRYLDRLLLGRFDRALGDKATALAGLLEQRGEEFELHLYSEAMPEFQLGPQAEYFEVWIEGQGLFERSLSLGEEGALSAEPEAPAPRFRDLPLPDGRRGRVTHQRVHVPRYRPYRGRDPGPAVATIVLARGRGELDRQLANLSQTLWTLSGAVILLSGVLAWSIVRLGLRPLDRVAREVEAIRHPDQTGTLSAGGLPDELKSTVDKINELLARIQAAFERERRTTANIAHELRTPIAELQALTGVALGWSDDPQYTATVVRQAHDISLQMRGIVTTLLKLTRLEARTDTLEPRPLPLAEFVQLCWREVELTAESKDLRLHDGIAPEVEVLADPGVLEIVLSNLLSNAVEYSPASGEVELVTSITGEPDEPDGRGRAVELRISNPSEALGERDLNQISEPFWRKDAARSSGRHAGLGLALVRQLTQLADVPLGFRVHGERFVASLTLPLSRPRPPTASNGATPRSPS